MAVTVKEIVMAAPDIIKVVARDSPVVKGVITNMGAPAAEAVFTNVTRTIGGVPTPGMVIGKNKDYFRAYDTMPTVYLDRAAVRNIANYSTIGGRTVTAVRYRCWPYDQGDCWPLGYRALAAPMEHEIYLVLSGNLAAGTYSIGITGNAFPTTSFTFNDKVTRTPAIQNGQIGQRPDDGEKIGYLSLWIPGHATEGAINYASTYGVSSFDVIDNHGNVVFTGPVTLMLGPTGQDYDGGGGAIALTWYASTTVLPKVVTAITNANPGVATCANHGFSNGDAIVFRGIGGMTGIEGVKYTVTLDGADPTNKFSFGVNTTALGTFTAGALLAGYNNLVYRAFAANRAATYVYKLDYSAFAPSQSSQYRLRIAGLGVGWPFKINPAIYLDAAKGFAKGYYNQCWGIQLNASYGGWDRPTALRDGVNGCAIYESFQPALFQSESAPPGAMIGGDNVGNATWGSPTRVTDFFGMWTDAGDWDWHLNRHMESIYFLLDLGYFRLPSGARDTQLGFPKASATWGSYTSMYAGIDALGDAIHMALHYLEPMRRFQKAYGGVFSGMNFAWTGTSRDTEGWQGGGHGYEPSYITSATPYCLAPDHWNNFFYVLAAAKLGQCFNAAGFTTLGATWIASAVAAWNWADAIYTGYAASGIASAAWIAHYITRLDIKTRTGWSDAQLTTKFDAVQSQSAQRLNACAALWAATGDTTYSAILEGVGLGGLGTFANNIACWEYSQAAGGNAGYKTYYQNVLDDQATTNYFNQYFTGLPTLYRAANMGSATQSWSMALNWLIYPFLTSGAQNQNNWMLKLLQANMNHHTGANQLGKCWNSGMGSDPPYMVLCRDREAMGIPTNQLVGMGCYAMFYLGAVGGGHGIYVNNLSSDTPSNYTVIWPTGTAEDTYGTKRLLEPYPGATPAMMGHIDNSYMIYDTEFVTQEQILRPLTLALFLHAWDGNVVNSLIGPVTVNCITH